MSIQTINIGNVVNDGLGDDLRTAFQKVNSNFTNLFNGLTITASNVGGSGAGIFRRKNNLDLEFKKLLSGTKIAINEFDETLEISTTQADAFTSITTNQGIIVADNVTNTNDITIQGINNIQVTASGRIVNVDTVLNLNSILKNLDFGGFTPLFDNNLQLLAYISNIDFGLLDLPANLNIDFGTLS
jgi:hypothetical protein